MKISLFILTLLFTNFIISQNLSEKISSEVCNCLSESREYTEEYILSCFYTSLGNHEDEFNKIDSTNENALSFVDKLFSDIIIKLQDNCDDLYIFILKAREATIEKFKTENSNTKIISLTDSINNNPNTKVYSKRAIYYFISDRFEEAKKDCLSCLEIDSNYIPCTYLLGWIEEKNLDYSKAIELYTKLENQGMPFMQLYISRLEKLTKE